MKLRPLIGWSLLLLLTHAVAFIAARPRITSGSKIGGGDTISQPVALPAAKASDRQRPKPPSVHAGLLAELNASDLRGEEYDKAFAAIFREWIKRDLRGALLFAMGPESGYRQRGLADACGAELNRELVAQDVQVGQWLGGGYFGSRAEDVARIWAEALATAGQQREIAVEALPHLSGPARVEVIDVLCKTAKDSELVELRRWMLPDSQAWLEDYAKRVVRFSGDDPGKIFAAEEDPRVLEELCKAYQERYIDSLSATAAVAASLKFPESYRQELLRTIAGWESGGVAAFTSMLSEMDRLGLWESMPADRQQEILNSAMEVHFSSYSLPQDIFAQLGGISRESTRLAAFKSAGARIARPGVEALVGAVEGLPPGKELDALIEGFWKGGTNFDAATGARVMDCVSDPALRARLQAPAAVGDGLENDPLLPILLAE